MKRLCLLIVCIAFVLCQKIIEKPVVVLEHEQADYSFTISIGTKKILRYIPDAYKSYDTEVVCYGTFYNESGEMMKTIFPQVELYYDIGFSDTACVITGGVYQQIDGYNWYGVNEMLALEPNIEYWHLTRTRGQIEWERVFATLYYKFRFVNTKELMPKPILRQFEIEGKISKH